MRPASNETSFVLLKSIIADYVDTYVHLSQHIKHYGVFPKQPVDSSGCASGIGSSNHITEDMAIYRLKDLFPPLTSRLCEEKERSKDQGIYLCWLPRINCPNINLRKSYLERKKREFVN